MIIKGGSRANWRFFSRHLMNGKDNERVRLVDMRGVCSGNVLGAFREMDAVASGTRCENFFYHADLNPRADEHLNEEQWAGAVDTLERNLGLEGQPRFVVEHEKQGRVHRHVIWSRIDVDTMTARSDSLTYQKHEKAAREIERDCKLEPVASVLVKDRETGPRPARRPKDYEGFRGVKTGLNPEDVQTTVTALWHESDSGAAFRSALEENGFILCKGDRVAFCIVDPAGKEHSLARRIADVRAADVYGRMGDIDRETLPTVAQGRKLADAWGGDSDAARAVRWKEAQNRLQDYRRAIEGEGMIQPLHSPQLPEGADRWERIQHAYAQWSPLEQAAKEYGDAVKDVAGAGQDAYWQAFVGGKPKTEADRLHELMWGEKERGGPDLER